jgi:DNA invertase Pin-like site-specific DNA recombinase
MTGAIYARKSTDQSSMSDEQRSVARQVEHARAYAARKGWRVLDEHVYVDDGISGAEFANRPGFLRLMNALKPRAPFQVLIMSEESRLGREAIETAYALKQLVQAGVRVFFYLEDRERTLDSPTDKIMLSLTAFADELERDKARQRTYDAMQRKARAGHVTGGRVFGYDNLEILGADGQRSHVERRVNADEAAVVRRIFELCAAGSGLARITKTLNAAGAPAPRPQQGRPKGWLRALCAKYCSGHCTGAKSSGIKRASVTVGDRRDVQSDPLRTGYAYRRHRYKSCQTSSGRRRRRSSAAGSADLPMLAVGGWISNPDSCSQALHAAAFVAVDWRRSAGRTAVSAFTSMAARRSGSAV